ncbi:peptide ABC transporter [Pelagivirga sediminicola]|uniref:Peptide ABC transporter n=1 Tax=Pelagivirga sediminicola TaxID=2170575 RepID=A0A2T7GCG8_9RHOB|nr:peptide ABC transporter substrate-binding protein [Pelagivirga sediminicola]PVA12099.1 peptide ABC transporter [Pelagivirga sediminicola]
MPVRPIAAALALCLSFTAPAADASETSGARGRDGQLRLYYWQAPSTLNPYLSGGVKDVEAASLIVEPLARLDPDGQMVPWLVQSIPTLENGGVAPDLRSITWRLKPGLTWSDGSPVTSADIRFTLEYCTAPGSGCAQQAKFRDVAAVDTPGPLTAVLRFDSPKPHPYGPFVGPQTPLLQAAQFAECIGPRAASCTAANFAPIGTGPFRAVQFRPGDAALFEMNPHYRVDDQPAFASVLLKGGGNANSAARTVLETGEFDYAWNLQLSPDVLAAMAASGKGRVVTAFSTLVERLAFNLREPAPTPSTLRQAAPLPHPAMSDPDVRRALAMALDRELMVEIGYGAAGRVTCNILPGPRIYASRENDGCAAQDIARAQAILQNAGWTDDNGDGVRERQGKQLRFVFQTSTNAVRQDFQLLAKEWWRQIGVQTELRNIDASVFFSSDASSPDTLQRFGAHIQMYAGASDGPDPEAYLSGWACKNIPDRDNGWQGQNVGAWCDPAYDRLLDKLAVTAGLEERAELARTLNDMLVQNHVVVPLVDRARISAHSAALEGVRMNAWDSELWNVAEWHRMAQ